jgi:hypothetical protein
VEVADCVFLAVTSLLSTSWYIGRLGFYSDDWGLFAAFQLSPDRSMGALVRASFFDRPVQGVFSILLYRLFGLHPLGYHAVNAVIIATMPVLLYLVIRRLNGSRSAAFVISLVYVLLPSYSTDRFWYAAFAAPASISLYLGSLLLDLSAVHCRGAALFLRRVGAVTLLVSSLLMYELALPLFFLNPLLAWYVRRQQRAAATESRRPNRRDTAMFWLAFGAVDWLLLVGLAAFKALTSPRLHAPRGVVALSISIVRNLFRTGFKDGDYGLNLPAAFKANYVDYVLALPRTILTLHHHDPSVALAVVSVAFGAIVFLYAKRVRPAFPTHAAIALVFGGLVMFLLGYTTFLTNKAIQITPAGIGNRTSIAAALGVAMSAAGMLGLLSSLVAAARRIEPPTVLAGLVAVLAAGHFYAISALSNFWIDAYARELQIVSDVEQHLGTPEPKTTLMLAGICSYNGPAVVFEADWDLSGALRLHYGDRTLSADVLRPGSYQITHSGIATILYEGEDDYDYGSWLIMYDYRRKTTHALTDSETAIASFKDLNRDERCPPGGEGVGVRVF